ncbi:hypothetical protein DK28_0207450 [Peptococcaceae bacterium SCADC1_2_3]|jgi:hypothetical protein|nr:hypothetical protein DK28_0207450 [Peptococcaceae bacterium SCADC1_2_3]KFI35313.1 hypothetical protein HY00_05690 [Peptococcaceae bacterium SCADC1_2_3]
MNQHGEYISLKVRFTFHAKKQMIERGIPEELVREAITNPGQVISQKTDISIFQILYRKDEKDYLLCVVARLQGELWLILTVYKTSKIKKYWGDHF